MNEIKIKMIKMFRKMLTFALLFIVILSPIFGATYISTDLDGHLKLTYHDAKFKDLKLVERLNYVRCEDSLKGLVCRPYTFTNSKFHNIEEVENTITIKNPPSMYIRNYSSQSYINPYIYYN